jgi:hypothetical protein
MPDIESTNQATNFLISNEVFKNGKDFPEWMVKKMAKFICDRQDPETGFFYHPQWGKELTDTKPSRRGRDLIWSINMAEKFDFKLPYPTANERLAAALKGKNEDSVAAIPEYLRSKEKFIEYMDSLDFENKAYWSGNQIAAQAGVIKAAGLYDFVHDYIVNKQNKETGLWGEGLGWMNTNGAMKLSSYFTDPKHPYPNPEKAFESVKKLYAGETPPTWATWVWNPFVLMFRILEHSGDNAENLRALLYSTGADIVNRAVDCALKMKRADGGFASSFNKAISHQQGYLFGHGTATESDLDGTLIAGPRLRNTIHAVFGVTASRGYYKEYEDEFWERCRNKPPVVKKFKKSDDSLAPNYK